MSSILDFTFYIWGWIAYLETDFRDSWVFIGNVGLKSIGDEEVEEICNLNTLWIRKIDLSKFGRTQALILYPLLGSPRSL